MQEPLYTISRGGKNNNDDQRTSPDETAQSFQCQSFPIAIIGAGFSGLCAAIKLKQAGIDSFNVFESSTEVGGTWRENIYPGAACDVPSHIYSFSFEPNPDWSYIFGRQKEILTYLRHCSQKYQVEPHIIFQTTVVRMLFDAERGLWTLYDSTGKKWHARAVIAGMGPLSVPAFPDLSGLTSFRGSLFHTAKWNSNIELAEKRVGVIGTGASAIQLSPAIAPIVRSLKVFQRTAAWVIPKLDRTISLREKSLCRRFPILMHWKRFRQYWLRELVFAPLVFKKNSLLKLIGESIVKRHIRRHIKDADLQKKLTPEYRFGCKRVLTSNDWYQTLTRENVELVDYGVDKITERGLITADGVEHELDVIIFATGFHVLTSGAPFEIRGLNGRTLANDWKDAAQSHNGVTIAGYPNLYLMLGPNSASTHTSIIPTIEAQADYAIKSIQTLLDRKLKYINVKEITQLKFNADIRKRMQRTVWIQGGCSSFYLTASGENVALFPGLNAEYCRRLGHFKTEEHDLVR